MLLWLILAEQAQANRLLGKPEEANTLQNEAEIETAYLLSQIKDDELQSSFLRRTRKYGLNLEMQLQGK